jgi:hypothetical protein
MVARLDLLCLTGTWYWMSYFKLHDWCYTNERRVREKRNIISVVLKTTGRTFEDPPRCIYGNWCQRCEADESSDLCHPTWYYISVKLLFPKHDESLAMEMILSSWPYFFQGYGSASSIGNLLMYSFWSCTQFTAFSVLLVLLVLHSCYDSHGGINCIFSSIGFVGAAMIPMEASIIPQRNDTVINSELPKQILW